ncbi:hypothetical protein Tco_1447774 [Tanacetum coccineum]
MDPNATNTFDHYDIYFQDDAERYMLAFEAYEQFLALSNQEAGGSGSGSAPKRTQTYIPRQREEAEQWLIDDYFGKDVTPPKYPEENFRRMYHLEEFCEKRYEKLLPIMADKYECEQRKKEKLEEVKARLDFGEAQKKTTRAQESTYYESRTMSPRRQRRSRSPRHNPSVFTRLRRERSRSPRHEYKDKTRREGTVFKRLESRGRSTSVHSDNSQESSRYTESHSESEDSEGGHWKSKS